MATLADAFIRLRPDNTRLGPELRAGTEHAAGDAGTNAGHHFGRSMASAIKKAAIGLAVGAALAGAAAGTFAKDAIRDASDLNETVSKAQNIFPKTQATIQAFAASAATSLGLSRQAALEGAASFGNFFNQIGIAEPVAAKMSTRLIKLSADLGSFNNADPSEVMNAFLSATRGEFDALQRFIPTVNAATVQEEALRATRKKSTKDLTEADKAQALYTIALRDAGKAQGDFARTADGAANQARILKAQWLDQRAAIGTALLPVYQKFLTIMTGQLMPALQQLWAKHGPAVVAFFEDAAVQLGGLIAGLQGKGPIDGFTGSLNTLGLAVRAFIQSVREGDVTSDGFVGKMERIGAKIHDIIAALRSGDASQLGASLGSAADSGKKLVPVVQDFLRQMPSLNDVVRVGAVLLKFLADHADTLSRVMPLLVGGVVAFKIAQFGANAAMVLSVPTKIFEVIVNRQLVRSNRELIASRVGLTAQTVLGTGATVANNAAESTGILTRARAIASMVLHKAASLAVRGATIAWTAVQWLLNAALTANPIGLIVVAIGLLIAAIVFVATKTTFFQTVWNAAWGGIKAAAKAVADWFSGPFINNFFKKAWDFLKNLVVDGVRFYLDRLAALIGFFRDLPGRIKAALGNLGNLLVDAGKNIVEGLWNGIKSLTGWLADKVKGFINSAVPGPVKKLLGIASPSKLFEGFGRDTIRGYARGWQAGLSELSRLSQSIVGAPVALASAQAGGGPMSVTVLADFGDGVRQVVRGEIVRSPDLVATANRQGAINVSRRG